MATLKHLRAILALPGTVTIVIPAIIVYFTGANWNPVSAIIGVALLLLGLALADGFGIALAHAVGKAVAEGMSSPCSQRQPRWHCWQSAFWVLGRAKPLP
jgi:hypothetical protein